MSRLPVLLIIILLAACQPPKEQPALSGVLWGGEGNRLLIRSATDYGRIIDTLLVDHQGEFVWNPDTVVPGFYLLEKNSDNRLVLVFNNKPVQVDAQYINFPSNAKVTGSDHAQDFFKVENITKNWQQALKKASAATSDSGWVPSPPAVANLKFMLDSITKVYQEDVLNVAEAPLVRMYALLQTAGQRQMFDPWSHRQLFYETDSLLGSYQFLNEVRQFSGKVSKLRETEQVGLKFQPGDAFPEMILAYDQSDTISTNDLRQSKVYIGIYHPGQANGQDLYQESLLQVGRYQWRGLKTAILTTDSASIIKANPRFFYHNYASGLSLNLNEELGIVSLPANFLLNEEGIIVAKNVWGDKLQQVLEQLHQK
jgi:hypothetical protein